MSGTKQNVQRTISRISKQCCDVSNEGQLTILMSQGTYRVVLIASGSNNSYAIYPKLLHKTAIPCIQAIFRNEEWYF